MGKLDLERPTLISFNKGPIETGAIDVSMLPVGSSHACMLCARGVTCLHLVLGMLLCQLFLGMRKMPGSISAIYQSKLCHSIWPFSLSACTINCIAFV